MPGLAGGTLRLIHMFLTPMFGTRDRRQPLHPVAADAGGRLVLRGAEPGYALLGADGAGLPRGAGRRQLLLLHAVDQPVLPKRLQGTALAIQAGIGNFGVSVVQFVTPWIIGFALVGGGLLGSSQTMTKGGVTSQVYLQNADGDLRSLHPGVRRGGLADAAVGSDQGEFP